MLYSHAVIKPWHDSSAGLEVNYDDDAPDVLEMNYMPIVSLADKLRAGIPFNNSSTAVLKGVHATKHGFTARPRPLPFRVSADPLLLFMLLASRSRRSGTSASCTRRPQHKWYGYLVPRYRRFEIPKVKVQACHKYLR